jgi:hypothetical protein
VIAALRRKNLTPVAGQVPCFDLEARIGTAADVVCVDGSNRLVIVELKTGYSGGAHMASNNTLKPPFQEYSDAPMHQHFLQLAATLSLFESTYCKRARGLLQRVDDAGVTLIWLPDAFSLRAGAVMAAIHGAAKDRRQERSSARADGAQKNQKPRPAPSKARGTRKPSAGRPKDSGPPRGKTTGPRLTQKPGASLGAKRTREASRSSKTQPVKKRRA